MRAALASIAILLLVPASAAAGGFATVSLGSLPDGTRAGAPWFAEFSILAHGRAEAPVDGLEPAVIITRADGSEMRRFPARPAGKPGVYRASVVFSSPGIWRYAVEDGYAGYTHEYPPVRIRDGAAGGTPAAVAGVSPSGGDGPNVALALLVAAVTGLVAAFATRRFA